MNINRVGRWNHGNDTYGVYEYREEHKRRMGSCAWLPKVGDLCICVRPSGDCFNNYVALREKDDGSFERVGTFGAYAFGEKLCSLDERTFHLACAGEPIELNHPNENSEPS